MPESKNSKTEACPCAAAVMAALPSEVSKV